MAKEKEVIYRSMLKIPYRRTTGNIKLPCPLCSSTRGHPNDRSLSLNLDTGMYKCHHCEASGILADYSKPKYIPRKQYRKPTPKPISPLSYKLIKYFNSRHISKRVLDEYKIGEGVIFMPQDNKEMNTIQFNYYLDGELINVKYRTGNKHFILEKDCELIPYNIDSISGKDTCIITEGEIDAMSFSECGFDSVISVPNGANSNLSYLDDFIDGWLDDKQTIYIASDTDTKGIELRQELIRRLGAERCKIVTYGAGCKDANEHLIKYGNASLADRIKLASDVKIEGVFELSDYENELDELFNNGLKKGMTIGFPIFDEFASFALGNFVVITGIPGSGKSTFLDFLSVRLCIRYGLKVGMFSPEDYPINIHASKLISNICGDRFSKESMSSIAYRNGKEFVNDNFFLLYPENPTLDCVLDRAKYLVKRKGIKCFILDPFNRLNEDLSDTNVISHMIDKMIQFAHINNVLFILMAHPRKMPTDGGVIKPPTAYDISGSQHFFNKADVIIVVHRYKEPDRTMVRIDKMRQSHMGKTGECYFVYNTINKRFIEVKDGEFTNYSLDNNSYLSMQNVEQLKPQSLFEYSPIDFDKLFIPGENNIPF